MSLGSVFGEAIDGNWISNGWWIAVFPALAIFLLVLAIEWARQAFLGSDEAAFRADGTKNPA
jgi:ABC-type dipeptide/oligopeptide/nickel transport system permease subunit